MPEPVSVLFVCLGNICRSTMAEGIFESLAKQPQYKGKIGRIDSCGTASYHAGDEPDSRTLATLEDNGITNYDHSARVIQSSDFEFFDYIFAMDRSVLHNLQNLNGSNPNLKARIMLFGEFSGNERVEQVSDPYYGGREGFEKVFEQCSRFSKNFLKDVIGE